jgi:NitT/TauT family transport system substrate-binding protein
MLRRRALLTSALLLPAARAAAAEQAPVRVGALRFGSLAWELDVAHTHGFDSAAGVTITPVEFAASQAAQVALQAGDVDVIVQDWLWVARQRASGADFTLSASSSALGAVVAGPDSPVKTIADLAGRKLGVAGSPLDKSWLILRAYAQKTLGLDLDAKAEKTFGPPPLLYEQLRQGRLDATLTYWPFAARSEAGGMRQVLDMAEATAALGVPKDLPMLGYVFSERWAASDLAGLNGFLAACQLSRALLGASDAEWERIAPLTGAQTPAELALLRDWYRRGAPDANEAADQRAAATLYDLLASIGGPDLVGPAAHLAPGTFWRAG